MASMLNWLLVRLAGCLSGGRAAGRVLSPVQVVGGNCVPVPANCLWSSAECRWALEEAATLASAAPLILLAFEVWRCWCCCLKKGFYQVKRTHYVRQCKGILTPDQVSVGVELESCCHVQKMVEKSVDVVQGPFSRHVLSCSWGWRTTIFSFRHQVWFRSQLIAALMRRRSPNNVRLRIWRSLLRSFEFTFQGAHDCLGCVLSGTKNEDISQICTWGWHMMFFSFHHGFRCRFRYSHTLYFVVLSGESLIRWNII